jgi:hypothetical protein
MRLVSFLAWLSEACEGLSYLGFFSWLSGRLIMPIYEYQCVDCSGRDQRVAGLDDHTSLCTQCSGLMLRLDEDVFQPYFDEVSSQAWPETEAKTETKASL